jgi:hypothetical protein
MLFAYDDEGVLINFENHATLSTKQLLFLKENFPFAWQDLSRLNGKHAKIEEHVDITFENFWETYNYKRGKIKAKEVWNKLSDDAKFKAISYIHKYKYEMKLKGYDMLYPERYLSRRRFDDE